MSLVLLFTPLNMMKKIINTITIVVNDKIKIREIVFFITYASW